MDNRTPRERAYERAKMQGNGAEPTLIKVEGYEAWRVANSDEVHTFDEYKTYPVQVVEQIFLFKKFF